MNLLQNYPFKCDDCNYATKYTHSLKLHLQKYSHNRRVEVNENEAVAPIAALWVPFLIT